MLTNCVSILETHFFDFFKKYFTGLPIINITVDDHDRHL